MKKDIEIREVEDVAVAIVKNEEEATPVWDVYLLNMKPNAISSILVCSSGLKIEDGEKRKTTELKQFFEGVEGDFALRIEMLTEELLNCTNQYHISFSYDGYLFDKKYIFVNGSIAPEHYIDIPILDCKGVMIK